MGEGKIKLATILLKKIYIYNRSLEYINMRVSRDFYWLQTALSKIIEHKLSIRYVLLAIVKLGRIETDVDLFTSKEQNLRVILT